jgi:beta-phosphoglucomutase-like phosphatase (HAD superfamily)
MLRGVGGRRADAHARAIGGDDRPAGGIEDARAGIEAIKAARMVAVGVGRDLSGADWLVADTRSLTVDALEARFRSPDRPRAARAVG